MPEFFNVGKIVNTQGLKGEVRVISTTDFPEERYKKGSHLFLFRDNYPTLELEVASHRKHKNFDIVSFKDYGDINLVEPFRDGVLKVSAEDMGELSNDEFYYHEIIGLEVVNEAQEKIGKVTEILSPGANDVWVVERSVGDTVYLPYIESVVKVIDLEGKQVVVEIPEGLIDDED